MSSGVKDSQWRIIRLCTRFILLTDGEILMKGDRKGVEDVLQHILWEQPHASSNKHVAGKLTLCVGMPVMLKHNDTTECCITKGAKVTVVSWQSEIGPEGEVVFDILFMKLNNPPKTIKLDGL